MSNVHPPASGNYWLRSGALTLLERGFGLLFNFGAAVLLLRLLSQEDFAAWGIFLLILYFIEMGRSGLLQNGLIRHLAIHRDEPEACGRIMSASLFLSLLYSTVTSLLLALGAGWIAGQYHVPQIEAMLPALFVANGLMVVYNHCYFVQQAYLEFRGVFWSTFFYRGALFVALLVYWQAGWAIRLSQIAWAVPAGAAVAALAAWWYARPFLAASARLDWSWVKKLFSYGKYVLGTNLSTMFYKNIDKLTLGHLLGPAAFAIYDAAGKVTQMVETPSFSIAAVAFPKSAERMAREGAAGVKRLYEKSVAVILAIILPFLVLVLLFAEPIIWLFAGEKYLASADVLRLTAFFGLFMPFAVQFGTVLDSTGRPGTNLAYTAFTAALNLTLSYWFIGQFGLFGAAFAVLAGYTVSFVLMQAYLYKHFRVNILNVLRFIPEFYLMGFEFVKKFARRGGWVHG